MPPTGMRGSHPVSPRDLTGTRQRQLIRAKADKEKAADLDLAALKRAEYQRGYEAGRAAGAESFTQALYDMYKTEGSEAVLEFLLELDDEPGEDS